MASSFPVHLPGLDLDDMLTFLYDDCEFKVENMLVDSFTEEARVFTCSVCEKVYKTKGGLSRYVKKHKQSLPVGYMITSEKLKLIIGEAAGKLSEDMCFGEDVREAFQRVKISIDESSLIWVLLKPVLTNFNGNSEKFFTKFYALLQPGKGQLFPELTRFQSTLLSTELANLCLQYLTTNPADSDITSKCRSDITFAAKDIASLEYLSGYCFRTIYARLRNSPRHRTSFSQQCMSILQAGKNSDATVEQRLVDVKDRGGLWKVSDKAIRIFKVCEIEFQIVSSGFHTSIDAEQLVANLETDVVIKANFSDICGDADLKVDKDVAIDLLHSLLLLYVRVRVHSYATHIKEKHKQQKKEGKMKSLRTSIKQRSSTTDLGH